MIIGRWTILGNILKTAVGIACKTTLNNMIKEKYNQYYRGDKKVNIDNNKYNIITLCGSIRFKDEFMKVQEKLTLEGNIVLIPNFFNTINKEKIDLGTKKMLDKMHKQKIDISDEIYVINCGGYIGESTKNEIKYAKEMGKRISYLESIK